MLNMIRIMLYMNKQIFMSIFLLCGNTEQN